MVTVLDASVRVDYLQNADSPAGHAVESLLRARRGEIVTSAPVSMELLAGARKPADLDNLIATVIPLDHVDLRTDLR